MRYMHKNGFNVISISADGDERREVISREGISHIIIPLKRTISPLSDLRSLIKLIFVILKEKPIIIHTHTPKAGLIGMLAAKLTGVNLKIHTIAGLPLMTATGSKRKLLEFTERLTYWAADYVLPNSNSIMSFVKKHQFTKNNKLSIIGKGSSNGIDLARFSKKYLKEEILNDIQQLINYPSSNQYILAVGRVVKDKGIIELVNAFLEIKKTKPKLQLIIVGPIEEERTEESLPIAILNALKENQSIIHVNWSEEVEYYMHLADILVHASHREGFPNVPLQAGAMECPIICSRIPGNIDIVKDKKTGLYFEKGDTEDLVGKINYALEHYSEMKIYAKALRKEIEANYSREYIHQELLKFYKEKLALIESKG